jgi:hypothetical protein
LFVFLERQAIQGGLLGMVSLFFQQSRPQDMLNSKQQFGGLMFVCILGGKISMWVEETLICNIR